MGPLFDHNMAQQYDAWFMSPRGRHVEEVENQLILDLLRPQAGESLLDVGCGTGNHLLLFRQLGLDVCGVDPSEPMLQIARQKLGSSVELNLASAEELPYEDNAFDIVTLISSLEFTYALHALSEAARVARSRVFIGVLNSLSANGIQRRMEALLRPTIYRHAKFYNVWELNSLVHKVVGTCRVQWGSVLWLPLKFYSLDKKLSRWMPRLRNPFGAFLGMSIQLGYSYRALLNPIRANWSGARKVDPSCCPLHRDLGPAYGQNHWQETTDRKVNSLGLSHPGKHLFWELSGKKKKHGSQYAEQNSVNAWHHDLVPALWRCFFKGRAMGPGGVR